MKCVYVLAVPQSCTRSQSKSYLGYCHNGNDLSSDKGKTEDMAEQQRPVNTRINRPKSSYVRRTTTYQSFNDSDDDSRSQVRPMSRCGVRSGDPRSRRMVLKETYCNQIEEVSTSKYNDENACVNDKHKNMRCSPTTGLTRQRSRIRGFSDTSMVTDISSSLSNTDSKNNCQIQEQTTVLTIDPTDSPIQKHRRQQLRSARSNRPTSENVFLMRHQKDARLSRPKSDKTLLNLSGNNKTLLSIDTSPNQGPITPKTCQTQQGPVHALTPQQRSQWDYCDRKPQSRPVSRRGSLRAEFEGPVRGSTKNMSMYGGRSKAIGLMTLPPLDPAVSQRTERALVAGETCA